VYVVLHGGGPEGVEAPFIANIINSLVGIGQSVFGFNFPYCERGEDSSSGSNLEEEVDSLKMVVDSLHDNGYIVTIVAKSLGGIVASFYLEKYPNKNIELVILGYVIGDVKTNAISNNLKCIIQGEMDRFGGADAVSKEIGDIPAEIIEIEGADHSYRNDKKEPVFQNITIDKLLNLLQDIPP
jgi:predicted alpha/beta-hydrolase family hydrolase